MFGFDLTAILVAAGAALAALFGVFMRGRSSGIKKERAANEERARESLEDLLEDVKHAQDIKSRPDSDPKSRLRKQSAGADTGSVPPE